MDIWRWSQYSYSIPLHWFPRGARIHILYIVEMHLHPRCRCQHMYILAKHCKKLTLLNIHFMRRILNFRHLASDLSRHRNTSSKISGAQLFTSSYLHHTPKKFPSPISHHRIFPLHHHHYHHQLPLVSFHMLMPSIATIRSSTLIQKIDFQF